MAGGREAPVATKQDARDARFRVLGLWRRARSGRRARWRRGGPDEHPAAANALVSIRARGRRARGWVVAFAKGGIRRAPPGCDRRTSPPCGSDESRTPRSRSRRRSPGRKRGGKGKVGVSDARRRRSSLVVPMPERGVRARAVGRGRDPRARSDHVTVSRRALANAGACVALARVAGNAGWASAHLRLERALEGEHVAEQREDVSHVWRCVETIHGRRARVF